jgi:hypothetical protein
MSLDGGDMFRGRDTGDLQWLGTDKEAYRPSYEVDTNVEADDWTKLINQCHASYTFNINPYAIAVSPIGNTDFCSGQPGGGTLGIVHLF